MLYPEYEVIDSEGRTRYLDHAYMDSGLLLDVEVDGYGPHLREMDRWQFGDERRRDVSSQSADWRVAQFSYDDVDVDVQPEKLRLEVVRSSAGRSAAGETPTAAANAAAGTLQAGAGQSPPVKLRRCLAGAKQISRICHRSSVRLIKLLLHACFQKAVPLVAPIHLDDVWLPLRR